MKTFIQVEHSSDVIQALRNLEARIQNRQPALVSMGEYLTMAHKQRFSQSVSPDGTAWQPNSPVTLARYLGNFSGSYRKDGSLSKRGANRAGNKKPLIGESRTLSTTIRYVLVGQDGLMVGTGTKYGAVQHFGAKKGAFGQTRHGAPIPWGDIPARPWAGMSDADAREVLDILGMYLEG